MAYRRPNIVRPSAGCPTQSIGWIEWDYETGIATDRVAHICHRLGNVGLRGRGLKQGVERATCSLHIPHLPNATRPLTQMRLYRTASPDLEQRRHDVSVRAADVTPRYQMREILSERVSGGTSLIELWEIMRVSACSQQLSRARQMKGPQAVAAGYVHRAVGHRWRGIRRSNPILE